MKVKSFITVLLAVLAMVIMGCSGQNSATLYSDDNSVTFKTHKSSLFYPPLSPVEMACAKQMNDSNRAYRDGRTVTISVNYRIGVENLSNKPVFVIHPETRQHILLPAGYGWTWFDLQTWPKKIYFKNSKKIIWSPTPGRPNHDKAVFHGMMIDKLLTLERQ